MTVFYFQMVINYDVNRILFAHANRLLSGTMGTSPTVSLAETERRDKIENNFLSFYCYNNKFDLVY